MEKQLIQLQAAHITQHKGKDGNTDWSIEENITNDKLGTLPKHFKDSEVFAVMRFAREFELKALNAGIDFQKDKNNEYLMAKIDKAESIIRELGAENNKLASVLDNMTKGN